MILRSIELENFGLYSGRQRLDLVPQKGRPVVLLGGRNGAGKTTLLEAVRLALYGKRALGLRVAQSEYEQHLRERVHHGIEGEQAKIASVGLEFDYAEAGVVQRYRVSRRWVVRGTKAVETLTLERDGAPVESVPRDEWHSFLQELVPPGVSQLFFFDGEKIADIARDGPDEGLADAVRGLLGIELVGRLRTDLGLFLARRNRRDEDTAHLRLDAIVRDIGILDRRIGDMVEDVAELNTQQLSQASAAAKIRQRFIAEGGDAAGKRAMLEATQSELREQIGRREHDLRELASGMLPFAMAPTLLDSFSAALDAAGDAGQADQARALKERLAEWRSSGVPERTASWDDDHWHDLDAFLALGTAQYASSPALLGLDVVERERLATRIAEARGQVPAKLAVLVADLDAMTKKLRGIDAELVRASGHAAAVVLDELLLAEKNVGLVEAQHRVRVEELRNLEYQRATLLREKDRAIQAQNEAAQTEERAALAGRVGQALLMYEERLLDLKIEQLRKEFVQRFNHLARKGDFLADARIDRSTFDATLIDQSGAEIRKSSLSAGEKQIYAIAMLWALARTSGRALPMIIDTPLARLDSEHRATIVEHYFPEASHQVIVLSTDTEVDERLLDRLSPSISHSYRLEYDQQTRSTHVVKGYFGDDEGGAVSALQQA